MTIRKLIQMGAEIDAHIVCSGIVVDENGEPIETDNKPVFECYLDDDGIYHVDAVYMKENKNEY